MQVANPEDVLLIEFQENIGPYNQDMIAIFNKNKISTDEVVDIIHSKMEDDRVVIVSKQQYSSVFL